MSYKLPVSVLVLIHTADIRILLLERADRPGFWQSVTGSCNPGEALRETARREVKEETGLDACTYDLTDWGKKNEFEIYRTWRWRYAPGVTHNVEHIFSLLLPDGLPIQLAPREHLRYLWLPWPEAADKVFSWTNAQAIRTLAERLTATTAGPP